MTEESYATLSWNQPPALKGIQKFDSRLRFFPDFDISMQFNANFHIKLQGAGVSFALILVLAIITWRC